MRRELHRETNPPLSHPEPLVPSFISRVAPAAVAFFLALPAAALQAQVTAVVRPILSDDTLDLLRPSLSPDGRWLVVTQTVSNQESRLLIRSTTGGAFRVVPIERGSHYGASFSPAGDRLFFATSIPRRSSSDQKLYLMSIGFDMGTGTTTGTARQITLDGVRLNTRVTYAVSPDGRNIVYVECCERNELRIVPVNGGNGRTLTDGVVGNAQLAGHATFAPDGRSVLYHKNENNVTGIWRVPVGGGKPTLVLRTPYPVNAIAPGGRYIATVEASRRAYVQLRTLDGKEVAGFSTPKSNSWSFTPDGQSIIGHSSNVRAVIKVVSLADGSTRTIGRGSQYEWADGWSPDSRFVHVAIPDSTGAEAYMRLTGLDGKVDRELKLPVQNFSKVLKGNQWVYNERLPGTPASHRIMFKDVATGRARVAVPKALTGYTVAGPTGEYYSMPGDETFYVQQRGSMLQVYGLAVNGTTRLVGEAPKPANGSISFAVQGQKLAYKVRVGDSTTLTILTPGRAPKTITAGKAGIGEFSFSKDGRQMALYTGAEPQSIHLYRLGVDGVLEGAPRVVTPPFEYFYEMFWLPDGSGLTMVAQPKGARFSEIALVRIADPDRPVLLTQRDTTNKWGHIPSPDSKWVAYPSEVGGGTSVWRVDLSKALPR